MNKEINGDANKVIPKIIIPIKAKILYAPAIIALNFSSSLLEFGLYKEYNNALPNPPSTKAI